MPCYLIKPCQAPHSSRPPQSAHKGQIVSLIMVIKEEKGVLPRSSSHITPPHPKALILRQPPPAQPGRFIAPPPAVHPPPPESPRPHAPRSHMPRPSRGLPASFFVAAPPSAQQQHPFSSAARAAAHAQPTRPPARHTPTTAAQHTAAPHSCSSAQLLHSRCAAAAWRSCSTAALLRSP